MTATDYLEHASQRGTYPNLRQTFIVTADDRTTWTASGRMRDMSADEAAEERKRTARREAKEDLRDRRQAILNAMAEYQEACDSFDARFPEV